MPVAFHVKSTDIKPLIIMTYSPIKKLVLGITGGIAAYKAAELVRLLVKQGIDVQVVMTKSACEFITPITLQALSGKPVFSEMWDGSIANGMPHIELSRSADAILIAPASANFLSKLVHGSADDLLSTLCLARDCPLIVAPAMNKQMWENPATQRNIQQLQADDIKVIGPDAGEQACGEVGLGRMLEPAEIAEWLSTAFLPKIFKGKRILVTAGPTLESIDPVRALTNFSSGKMGYSIARVAQAMGAEVTLVSGPTSLTTPLVSHFESVTSAEEMYQAVMYAIAQQDIFIGVAAVADYRPAEYSAKKIKKSGQPLTLELIPNRDIIAEVAAMPNAPFCVGFAAESDDLLKHAEEKRQRKKLPLVVANIASDTMGKDDASIVLLDDEGTHTFSYAPKAELAATLLQHIANIMNI
ncbi:phosphopantothenoylcysteine decarboxylase [Methyloradius palustris]|uniref:Coenzyme A biosynthesis bifunctional protein CoaBC n=2 Tax=Methyloradius palustris TaxID=2778876 RepID=A0A8D5G6H0_9PROT|nr:phosphopantothenoylcysteine decarboxylase [Methyloradius palustris]